MLGLVLLIAAPVQRLRAAMPTRGLAVIWALAWVIVANRPGPTSVAILAAAGIVMLSAAMILPRRA